MCKEIHKAGEALVIVYAIEKREECAEFLRSARFKKGNRTGEYDGGFTNKEPPGAWPPVAGVHAQL